MEFWRSLRSSVQAHGWFRNWDSDDTLALMGIGGVVLLLAGYMYASYALIKAWPALSSNTRWIVVTGASVWWLSRSIEDGCKVIAKAMDKR